MDIITQLKELRLHGMGRSWQALTETREHHGLTLQEGLGHLIQAEMQHRDEGRFERLCINAHFRYRATVEELAFDPSRGLDRGQITDLAMGNYIRDGQSVLVCGAAGVGKSFLISALGYQACAQGYRVMYFNLQKLLLKMKISRVDGTIFKFMDKLSKTQLLILDDFGLTHLEKQQRLDLMEIMEDRLASLVPAVSLAQRHIAKRGELVSAPKIVAELPLGFWVTLFNIEYELILWKPLRKAFPNMPKAIRQRKNVSAPLNNIRLIRNRIFHNEPVCWNLRFLQDRHNQITELLEWIDADLPGWLATMDRFDAMLVEIKAIIR